MRFRWNPYVWCFSLEIAQLGDRWCEKLKVSGSILGFGSIGLVFCRQMFSLSLNSLCGSVGTHHVLHFSLKIAQLGEH